MSGAIDRVAGRADRAHDVADTLCVQCLAQASDVDVHGPRLDINIMAPHRVEQLLARKDPPGIPQQMAQEAEFRRAEMDRLARARHPVRGEIHLYIGEMQHLLPGTRLSAPDHGAQPGDEFARAERLDDIVVGTAVEPAYPVTFLA